MSVSKCIDVANRAIMHVAESLHDAKRGTSVLTCDFGNVEDSLRNSLKASCDMGTVKESLVYVMGKNTPITTVNIIAETVAGITNGSTTAREVESDTYGTVMLADVETAKFDTYDALGIIPTKDTMDWDVPESSIPCTLDLQNIER